MPSRLTVQRPSYPQSHMSRRLQSLTLAGVLVAGAALGACSDPVVAPSTSAAHPTATRAAAEAALASEQAALHELTRITALAFDDQGLRTRVKNDLRLSRFTREHKLEFRSYLHGQSGGILLAKMTAASGAGRDSVERLLAAVRPLEFYMPGREQRETWTGGADLLVASLLDDEDVPSVFDLQGNAVAVGVNEKTPLPTLAIVPVETDFTRPLEASKIRNTNDKGGQTVGTYLVACDASVEYCGGNASVPPPAGRDVMSIHLDDVGESFLKGAPEIEVHVHGPQDPANPQYGADLACAGEHQIGDRYFDQESNDWSGSALIFSNAQNADYGSKFSSGYNVILWEDDDGPCIIRNDNVNLASSLRALGTVTTGVVAVVTGANPAAVAAALGTFVGNLYNSAAWLKSNDDYLGTAVRREYAPNRNVPGNYVLYKDGNRYNGYITLSDY